MTRDRKHVYHPETVDHEVCDWPAGDFLLFGCVSGGNFAGSHELELALAMMRANIVEDREGQRHAGQKSSKTGTSLRHAAHDASNERARTREK